jgi:hypothetical protein
VQVIGAHQVPYKNEKILKSERQLTVQIRIHGVDNDIQLSRTKSVKNSGKITFVMRIKVVERNYRVLLDIELDKIC